MRKLLLLCAILLFTNMVNAEKNNPDESGNGDHFKISVPAAGMLKTRLENAVLDNSDYDVVDSLTVKGKFGGEDLAYLVKSEGILSELTYLDLSQVELVYDDKEYLSSSSSPGLYWATINHYLFSSENRDESRNYLSGGKTVTENAYYRNDFAYAFNGNKKLIDCRLPKQLKGIGEDIFNGCEALEKVTLSDNPTYVGNNAFKQVALKTIELPASVEKVGDYAFAFMPIENIDLSHVRSFGEGCLAGTSIKNIQLADGMERIPDGMFMGCQGLTEVIIPGSVKMIGKNAFSSCGSLSTVTIPGTVTTVEDEAFSSCGQLKNVTIEEGVKKMGSQLFQECWALENFSFPSTIEEVGHHIFSEDWLRNTTLPLPFENGIWYIGKVAYALEMEPWTSDVKNGLTSLDFKEGTISIADEFKRNATGSNESVYGFDQVKTISLPLTLRRIGRNSLSESSVSSITLPNALEYIGDGALGDSKKLRRITIPENVKYMGTDAFRGCGIMRVYYNAIEADVYKWVDIDGNVQYASYPGIFRECPMVRVYIGEGVKKLPATLFYECYSLARVQMASTVESIGEKAFAGCTSLEHIDLPSSLKEIANDALPTSNLKSVACYMKEPIDMGFNDEDIFAHAGSLDEFTVYDDWQEAMARGEDYYYGWWYPSTPLGGAECYYRIDENGKVSWGYWYEDLDGKAVWTDKVKTTEDAHLALLQVPKGLLSTYQSQPLWSAFVDKIEALDGASDVEPVNQTTTVTVSESVKEDTDLSNTMMGNIFVTLDVEDSGDGFNAQEGCLIINSTTSEEGLAAATAENAEDLTVKNMFNGLIFEVSAGKGSIAIDCQTLGQNVVFVKIGDAAPQEINTGSRQQSSVPYDVEEDTHVYIYAAKASVERNSNVRRAAYANDDAVKIYAVNVNVEVNNNPNDIEAVVTNDTLSYTIYTIDGKEINTMQKGVNIIRYSNGSSKKVYVK